MLLDSVFQVKERVQFGNINDIRDFIEVDASIKENHTRALTISDTEIEDGSKISDHTNRQPERVDLDIEFSEIPVDELPSAIGVAQGAAFSQIRQAIGGLGGIAVSEARGYMSNAILKQRANRLKNHVEHIERYMNDSVLLFLRTDVKDYEFMIIESATIPRSVEMGNSLILRLSMRTMKIVSSETVLIPEVRTKNIPSAASEQSSGKQQVKQPTTGQEARGSSVAFRIFGGG